MLSLRLRVAVRRGEGGEGEEEPVSLCSPPPRRHTPWMHGKQKQKKQLLSRFIFSLSSAAFQTNRLSAAQENLRLVLPFPLTHLWCVCTLVSKCCCSLQHDRSHVALRKDLELAPSLGGSGGVLQRLGSISRLTSAMWKAAPPQPS